MNERRALGFGLSAVLLWSTVATACKLTLAEFSPIQMLTIASIVSSIALIAVCAFQGKLSQLSTTFLSNPWYYLLLGLVNQINKIECFARFNDQTNDANSGAAQGKRILIAFRTLTNTKNAD